MPDIMYPNPPDTGQLTCFFHRIGQISSIVGKQSSLIRIHLIHILLDFPAKEIRNRYFTLTFLCLRRSKNIFSFHPLVSLINRNHFRIKIHILRKQSKQFAFSHTCPIQHFEAGINTQSSFQSFTKIEKFLSFLI